MTRDLAIDSKGTLYIGIGSASNVGEDAPTRATVQTVAADGSLHDLRIGPAQSGGHAILSGYG